jgi:hypothetical protein
LAEAERAKELAGEGAERRGGEVVGEEEDVGRSSRVGSFRAQPPSAQRAQPRSSPLTSPLAKEEEVCMHVHLHVDIHVYMYVYISIYRYVYMYIMM